MIWDIIYIKKKKESVHYTQCLCGKCQLFIGYNININKTSIIKELTLLISLKKILKTITRSVSLFDLSKDFNLILIYIIFKFLSFFVFFPTDSKQKIPEICLRKIVNYFIQL